MFCKHDYEILNKTVLGSAFEQYSKVGGLKMHGDNMAAFFRKKLILVMKCPKCKKVKVITKANP